jgi:lysozyme
MREQLVEQIKRDEGRVVIGGRHVAYQDHLGFWTLGYGRLVDRARGGGITEDEAQMLLERDIDRCDEELRRRLPVYAALDEARQGALLNMAFQLGVSGLLAFRRTLAHVAAGAYDAAASEMLQSRWAVQTPARAQRIATQMRTGVWQ